MSNPQSRNHRWSKSRKVSEMKNPTIPKWDTKSTVTTNTHPPLLHIQARTKHPFIGKKVVGYQLIDLSEMTRFDVERMPTIIDIHNQWFLIEYSSDTKIWLNSNEILQLELV